MGLLNPGGMASTYDPVPDVMDLKGENGSNALILPGRKKHDRKISKSQEQEQQLHLKKSKGLQRKLQRLQKEKEKRDMRAHVMETLEKHKLADDDFALLHSSGTLGKEETMREKLQRAMNYKRAGLPVPANTPLLRERPSSDPIEEVPVYAKTSVQVDKEIKGGGLPSKQATKSIKARATNIMGQKPSQKGTMKSPSLGFPSDILSPSSEVQSSHGGSRVLELCARRREGVLAMDMNVPGKGASRESKGGMRGEIGLRRVGIVIDSKDISEVKTSPGRGFCDDVEEEVVLEKQEAKVKKGKRKKLVPKETGLGVENNDKVMEGQYKKKKKKRRKNPVSEETRLAGLTDSVIENNLEVRSPNREGNIVHGKGEMGLHKVVVPINRREDIQRGREKLPIVMMEQEIMEAITEHDVAIVCGETGCGKTTQVPQFLFEAGYGSSLCKERSGIIGVTQPRRVAVLATAKRVAYEMNVGLGQEVGFQVRHDRKIGDDSCIKFMTDGILLREVQADFLLRKYSMIVLDEAHERSLNTDILIGMLSRILPLRKSMYEEYCKVQQQKPLGISSIPLTASITPLKLVIMSATLRVEDFVSNRRMFPNPPPVVQVPARQFPVTIHFSARTEILDYVDQAYKKVCVIHRKLPPGGILVFLTGQKEVETLCRKLRKSFIPCNKIGQPKAGTNDLNQETNVQELDLEAITKAMDGNLEKSAEERNAGLGFGEADADGEEERELDWWVSDDDGKDSSIEVDDDYLSETDEAYASQDSRTSGDIHQDTTTAAIGADEILKVSLKKHAEMLRTQVCQLNGPVASADGSCLPNLEASQTNPDHTLINCLPGNNMSNMSGESNTKRNPDKKTNGSSTPGPLHVLPLYAMLPAAAQLRVFSGAPEGARLVVIATNVAETSITIPGIRYVVDSGRAKERDFDRASGISKYVVRWISKASANQRAGRAGRTGPGHCYRLYSSAMFNNTFPQFAPQEMSKAPIEGVILFMKRMGINKVMNFPFPSPPEREALVEGERCLRALSALDPDTGLLTPIGRAMAIYPISPRHARMLLAALHAAQKMEGKGDRNGGSVVLAFAIAAAAALSHENPLLRDVGVSRGDDLPSNGNPENAMDGGKGSGGELLGRRAASTNAKEEIQRVAKHAENWSADAGSASKEEDADWTEAEMLRRKQRRAAAGVAHGKFRNSKSDALTVVKALWAYEKSDNRDEFCELQYLHAKTMQEMMKLRQQLAQLVIQYSCEAGAHFIGQIEGQGELCLSQDFLMEAEKAWQNPASQTLSLQQETALQQAICAGWADRVARRLSARERAQLLGTDGKHRKAIRYQACAVEESVYLHPSSAVFREAPEFVVHNEIIHTTRPYMWGVTAVDAHWLVSHANPLCIFSKPLADPPPWYDSCSDQVMCWVTPSFGPHLWELPLHSFPMKNSKTRVAIFAFSLLQGKVVPSFSSLLLHTAADPGIICKPEAHVHKRVGELLHRLSFGPNEIDTRNKLGQAWSRDPTFLYPEILAWLQTGSESKLKDVWNRAQQEAQMDGKELYGKQAKKRKP